MTKRPARPGEGLRARVIQVTRDLEMTPAERDQTGHELADELHEIDLLDTAAAEYRAGYREARKPHVQAASSLGLAIRTGRRSKLVDLVAVIPAGEARVVYLRSDGSLDSERALGDDERQMEMEEQDPEVTARAEALWRLFCEDGGG
jgi:hypothetical protein